MLRKLSIVIMIAIMATLGYTYLVRDTQTASFQPDEIIADINVDSIFSSIKYLAQKPREAGTEGEFAAVQYIKKQFENLGYETKLQPFPLLTYQEPTYTHLFIQDVEFPVQVFEFSGNGSIRAELVNVKKASKRDLMNVNLEGKIAFIERGDLTLYEKIDNVQKKGAIGAIMYNNEGSEELFNGTQDPRISLPSVAVSREAGLAILQEMKAQTSSVLEASIEVEGGKIVKTSSYNVIARKAPALVSEVNKGTLPIVSIGAHHDSVKIGPGANDDASGTAVLLELARIFANKQFPAEIRFVTFGAEEKGLIGSYYYVNSLNDEEKQKMVGHFQLDMVGSKDAGGLIMYTVDGRKNTVTDLAANASALVSEVIPYGKLGRSDHVPFHDAGIPAALFIHSPVEPWYHTENDTIDKISKDRLKDVTNIVATGVYQLAQYPSEANRVCYDASTKQLVIQDRADQKQPCTVEYRFENRKLD